MADTVRVIAAWSDVLAAIASAATLLIEALERIEQNAIAISSLIDGD